MYLLTFSNHLEHHLCDVLHLYPRGGTSTCDYKVIAVFGAQSSGKSLFAKFSFRHFAECAFWHCISSHEGRSAIPNDKRFSRIP